MKYGAFALGEAEGAALAHTMILPGRSLKKGRVLTAEDVAALGAAGKDSVVAAKLEPGDIAENDAAALVAEALKAPDIETGPAFTGRINFFAQTLGLCLVDRDAVDAVNLVDEAVTLATVAPYSVVGPKQMVATVKVIPFAVPGAVVRACADKARQLVPPFRVVPFRERHVAMIQTRLPGLKDSVLEKTVTTTRDRLTALGSVLIGESRCAHEVQELVEQLRLALRQGADLVLVAGASAIIDRRDVIPAALTAAGGRITHFGMPVDPGNLILMGELDGAVVMGLPGCARSPKLNGYDFVLQRLLAGLPAGANEIMRMGVGGLLADIPSRPMPRAKAAAEGDGAAQRAPRIAALILAAGQSTRMGTLNKLTIEVGGKPMVRHAAEAALGSKARPVTVVTGHEREAVEAALSGLDVAFVHNPDYAQGLSTSMKTGLAALAATADGAVMLLGDMPRVAATEIDRLIAAFNPTEGRAIVVPARKGKRGNPVLLGRQVFHELARVEGDRGAREVIAAHDDLVAEIDVAGDGILTDIDTPQALAKLRAAR
ncbi:MAG: NTP transferase domain-containing protein [Stellaceae bacterium]